MRNKHKAFTSLSRRQRRAHTQHIKNLIHAERARCGGLYYDDGITSVSMIGGWQWADIYFLGNTPDVYWNATISTVADELHEAIDTMACDEAYSLLSEAEREEEYRIETTPNYNAAGKVVSHTWVDRQKQTYEQFGGLTQFEYVNKRVEEIARDNPPVINPGYRIHPGYASGIGLEIIVDVPELSRDVIESAIRSFLKGNMPSIPSK